jgi:hypothetical protein
MRVPRAFALQSVMQYGIEPYNGDDDKLRETTIKVLKCQTTLRPVGRTSVWTTSNADYIPHLLEVFTLSQGDFELHQYAAMTDKDIPSNINLQALIEYIRLPAQVDDVEAFVRETRMEGATAATVMLEELPGIPNVKFSMRIWSRAVAARIAFDYPYLILGANATIYKVVTYGSGTHAGQGVRVLTDTDNFMDFEVKYDRRTENKFNVKRTEQGDVPADSFMANVTAMNKMSQDHLTTRNLDCPELVSSSRVIELRESKTGEYAVEYTSLPDVPDAKSMDYWDMFDDLHDNIVVLPERADFTLKSRLEPDSVRVSTKLRMEETPTVARPSLTMSTNSTLNSITSRHGSFQDYVKHPIKVDEEFEMLIQNYFRKDFNIMSRRYNREQVNLNPAASMKWCVDHNSPEMVLDSLKELFDMGFEMNPINSIKAHSKVEQTTRLEKAQRWFTEVYSRSIMASAYCISALFAPVMNEIKKRMKDAFKLNVVYTDGYSPQMLTAHASSFETPAYIVEDDLSKQDAATTHTIISVEFMVYAALGLDPGCLEMYKWIHHNWRWKSAGMSGICDAMRLTGQPTTSLGNTITNMVVHNRFVMRNSRNIILIYMLGDDNIMFCKTELDVSKHGTETKELYNIQSKVKQTKGVGDYLCMLAHVVNGKIEFCPNFLRLRHRFSVCNYAFMGEERKEKLHQRRLSYSLMLGNVKAAADWLKLNYPGVSCDWYDVSAAIQANCMYHGCSEEVVLANIGKLLDSMRSEPIESKAVLWVTSNNRQSHRIDKATLSSFVMS